MVIIYKVSFGHHHIELGITVESHRSVESVTEKVFWHQYNIWQQMWRMGKGPSGNFVSGNGQCNVQGLTWNFVNNQSWMIEIPYNPYQSNPTYSTTVLHPSKMVYYMQMMMFDPVDTGPEPPATPSIISTWSHMPPNPQCSEAYVHPPWSLQKVGTILAATC